MSNYQKISNKIQKVIIDNPQTSYKIDWLNIIDAGKKEIDYLKKYYSFDLPDLQAASGKSFAQRPSLIVRDNYLFLILHFPALKNDSIITGEIEFFVGHQFLVTFHNNNIPALTEIFNTSKKDQTGLKAYQAESSAILLVDILEKLINSTYHILDTNSQRIEDAEDIIFARRQKQAVGLILDLRHNIINIRKILQNHKNILKKLSEQSSSLVNQQRIKDNYEQLVEHSKRIWEILDNQKEMIEALNSTNESMINNTLNNIMKTLTIFSVTVVPLTLLASIFGMNAVNMPLVNQSHGFWYIIGIMLIGSAFMLMWFKHKKWL